MKQEDVVIVQRAYRVAALRFIVSAVGGEQRRRAEGKQGSRSSDEPVKLNLPEEPLRRMIKRRTQSTAIGLTTGGLLAVALPEQKSAAALVLSGSIGSLLGGEYHYRTWTAGKTRALMSCVQGELQQVGGSLKRLSTMTDGHLMSVGNAALKAERTATQNLQLAFNERAKVSKKQAGDLAVDVRTFVEDYGGPLKTIEQWPHLKAGDLRALIDTPQLSL